MLIANETTQFVGPPATARPTNLIAHIGLEASDDTQLVPVLTADSCCATVRGNCIRSSRGRPDTRRSPRPGGICQTIPEGGVRCAKAYVWAGRRPATLAGVSRPGDSATSGGHSRRSSGRRRERSGQFGGGDSALSLANVERSGPASRPTTMAVSSGRPARL